MTKTEEAETAQFQLELSPEQAEPIREPIGFGSLDLRLADCMDVMKTFPDGYFDLAIVDPPYGIGEAAGAAFGAVAEWCRKAQKPRSEHIEHKMGCGSVPGILRGASPRVEESNYMGREYFPLPPTRCVIAWDKEQPWPNFSAWEMAWTSLNKPAKIFRWNNQGGGGCGKIHPTQKPVALYKWILSIFADPGMRVLDTHLGSGSHAIAAHYAGIHLTACEIDPDYFHAAKARIERETRQTELFPPMGAQE